MQGETILAIATGHWNSLWGTFQQTMSRFALHNRVVYFNSGRHPERSAIFELLHNIPNYWMLRPQVVQDNLIVVPTPSSLPHVRRFLPRSILKITMPIVIKFNAQILIRQVRWSIDRLKIQSPILWLYSPYQINLIGKFGEKLVCYHNYDEFSDFEPNARIKDMLRYLDNELTKQVDVVFATSQAQAERRKAINPNTYFIPNGVDFNLFNRALDPGLSLPSDIADLPHPIIGFAGWMGYHIDVALLRKIAENFPDSSLVLVGPDQLPKTSDYVQLRTLSNVYFLGQKDMNKLPNYLKAFDVALMPWLLTGHVRSAYPLKLHEYLAAGRAIVSTALPELIPYSNVIRITETHLEFIAQIREALHDHSSQAIEKRVAVARENTWDNRVADMYRILQPFLIDGRT